MDKSQLVRYLRQSKNFIAAYFQRCKQDQITMVAGYLAYISLLSLVPFIAVIFSMLGVFPMFEELKSELEQFIFANVIPTRGEEIQSYINTFISNTRGMTTIGILVLIVVALLLIYNIDKTLNKIWRVKQRPRPIISFSIYWMILTLGPVLIGTSIAVTSYLATFSRYAEDYTPGLTSFILWIIPYVMSLLAFFILYLLVPNLKVRARHALWGALLATILFEFFKRGFTLYVSEFPSYQALYGALALVPILFIWVYLSWVVVLLGAELTALLQQRAELDEAEKSGESQA
ncbi:virulence factor BrkB family protein [Arsukibacterium sp.]|uniref:virulence factor BrkB family protein n=1 Tax=Arsukibacterium sp. TaxID=1977258 RepID=UPI00299D6837|nr:virulence factor BrkB family protein [Arsukibacterium sp.]MDX1678216.1 virulence factor BrkB family protein [Arsukibacterium sp.]